jgi:hypothetical protein
LIWTRWREEVDPIEPMSNMRDWVQRIESHPLLGLKWKGEEVVGSHRHNQRDHGRLRKEAVFAKQENYHESA